MNKQLMNKISKYLSYILRHKPESIGIKLDDEGWVDINELIVNTKDFKLNIGIIKKIVESDNKQRYTIKDNKIRANQGHSINVNLNLIAIKPPDILYHGTATRFYKNISKLGLIKQNRQHVHLSEDLETAKTVGARYGKLIILKIDTIKMFNDGIKFYKSENGVWLTDNVKFEYISILDKE